MATASSGAAGVVAAAVGTAVKKTATTTFVPRRVFDASPSITRSYFLGHHHAAVNRMRQVLSNIGLVIECRDMRVPLSSWNPILEGELSAVPGRARIIVYTKRDLGPARQGGGEGDAGIIARLTDFHNAEQRSRRLGAAEDEERRGLDLDDAPAALFLGEGDGGRSDRELLSAIKGVARRNDSLVGLRALVVGMPNAGKSTLLNRLRKRGVGKDKAAATGAQPGVTRKLGTPVRIVDGGDGGGDVPGEGVFVMDTPGVFVPYVANAEVMLKLSLVGCVKDGVVPAVVVADYLLFHLNLHDPSLYTRRFGMEGPTNDVAEFLDAVARRTGKLGKGGVPIPEGAAEWVIQQWRKGELGAFLLDDVSEESLRQARHDSLNPVLSMNQARIRDKERKKGIQIE